jgi:hypothetical protein
LLGHVLETTVFKRCDRWRKSVTSDRLMQPVVKAALGKIRMIDGAITRARDHPFEAEVGEARRASGCRQNR